MNKPISRKTNIVVQDLENEVLIYDLEINKAFCLNKTSALVYEFADGTKTVGEISNEMSVKLKIRVSEDLVWMALEGLKKDNLLANADELTDHFGGLTRREVVKRVGFASVVMLPLISTVIAPNAVMAQSGCAGNGLSCTFASYTQSNCCNTDQRCWDPSGVSPTCRTCFPPTSGPQASCGSPGCCNSRADKNLCCSGSYTETVNTPTNILCFCA